jgi:DNA-binding SARP family transcriptional activator
MPHLSLSLLGTFEVVLDGQPVTAFEYEKVRALLAYLAVESDRPRRREVITGLLWPDRPEQNARQNLSQALFNLRHVLGDHVSESSDTPPFLWVTPQTLQFNRASDYWLDVTVFSTLQADCQAHRHDRLSGCEPCLERMRQTVALYRGDFLEGFSLPDSVMFEDWMTLNREHLHRRALDALIQLADSYEERGEYEAALTYAQRAVELESWWEEAARRTMRLLALSGRRGSALAQYDALSRALSAELGADPAAETTRLYERIRDGVLERAAPHTAAWSPCPPATATSFVSREPELERLTRFLDQAMASRGRVAMVTGDAGVGKTALLREFARRSQAARPDLIVAGGSGNAYTGMGDRYLPFREVLAWLTGDVEERPAGGPLPNTAAGQVTSDCAGRLRQLLPQAVRAVLDAGPDLLENLVSGTELLRRGLAFVGGSRRPDWLVQLEALVERRTVRSGALQLQPRNLFDQYTRVLAALANEHPLLLLLDDLQWADLGSISLLFHLGRRIEALRILIVGAYRPAEVALGHPAALAGARPTDELSADATAGPRARHPLEPVVHELKRAFGEIELDLGRAEGRAFVDALVDAERNALGEGFRQELFRHTRGHPLFAVEFLRDLQGRGDLARDAGGRWVETREPDWGNLPARVEAVIEESLGRLPERWRDVLATASVQGETFTAEAVARVAGIPERDLVHWLSEHLDREHHLVSAVAVRAVGGRRLSEYRFRYAVFRTYLYRRLDPAERAYLNDALAAALAQPDGGQIEL